MHKRIWAMIPVCIFLISTVFYSCGNTPNTSQTTLSTANNNRNTRITVESYKSDQLKKSGYDLMIQGVRFPIPTTLNELGEEWTFNSGDIHDRESGEVNGQRYWRAGNIYTAEWYKAGTSTKIYDTTVPLCYNGNPVLTVLIEPFDEKGKYDRATKIIGVGDADQYREQGLLEVTINGIGLGNLVDQAYENQFDTGKWVETKDYKEFVAVKNGMSVFLACSPEKVVTSLTIREYMPKSKTPNSAPTE